MKLTTAQSTVLRLLASDKLVTNWNVSRGILQALSVLEQLGYAEYTRPDGEYRWRVTAAGRAALA